MGRHNWLPVLAAVMLVSAGCGGGNVFPAVTPTMATASISTAPPTTTTTAATTTVTTTTTTTTTPLEVWQVPGRHYYFPIQPAEAGSFSGSHHDYPASDIFAPEGTAIVAVTSGVVDELRRNDPWDPEVDDPATRGGRFVSVVGDDGVRYYCSHLQSVAEGLQLGARVRGGQVIGALGRSGDAVDTSPHCHFGISRPTFPGDWEVRRGEVWPQEYLEAWQRGQDVTPVLPHD